MKRNHWPFASIALGVVGLFVFAACGDPTGPGSVSSGEVSANLIEVSGVQCVIMDGYRSGGISCNWEAYNAR